MGVLERYPHPKYPRLVLQQRSDSRFFQAVTYIDQRLRQWSTRSEHLPTAFKLAEDWDKKLVKSSLAEARQHPIDKLSAEPLIADVYRAYLATLTKPRRDYIAMRFAPNADFWRSKQVSNIDAKTFREFYAWRRKRNKRLTNATIWKDVAALRCLLHHAVEEGYIERLPIIPQVGAVPTNPRPRLTPAEWRHLVEVATARIDEAKSKRLKQERGDLLEMSYFLVLTMMRVGEMLNLRFSDCRIEKEILIAHVTGKRGARTVVAPKEAANVIKRRLKKHPAPSARIFPTEHKRAFQALLKAAGLYRDAAGFTRNLKSLRVTAISFRVLEPNPNLLLIARNAGTSLAMIDNFYAKRLSAEMHRDVLGASIDAASG